MEFRQRQAHTAQQKLSQQFNFNHNMKLKLELLSATQSELVEQLHSKLGSNPAVIWQQRKKITTLDDEERRDRYALWLEAQPNKINLKQHFMQQIRLLKLSAAENKLAFWLTYNLNEQGFHRLHPYSALPKRLHSLLDHLLSLLQQLDPLGCYCQDSYHSLQVQARSLQTVPATLERIFSSQSLYLIAQNRQTELAASLHISLEQLEQLLSRGKRELNPFPASTYVTAAPALSCELILQERDGEVKISYYQSGETFPKIDRSYQKFAQQTKNKEAQQLLREAQILLDGLEGRKKTLLLVAYCIIEKQPYFLKHGLSALQPLYAKQIAQSLNMHPSTVSRTMRGKYMQTPHGLLSLSQFCSTGLDGKSRNAIKEQILELLQQQTSCMSDKDLCDQLMHNYGIRLSRRTVNKYKHELMREGRWFAL